MSCLFPLAAFNSFNNSFPSRGSTFHNSLNPLLQQIENVVKGNEIQATEHVNSASSSIHTKSVLLFGALKHNSKASNKLKYNSSTCTLLHSPLQASEKKTGTGVMISYSSLKGKKQSHFDACSRLFIQICTYNSKAFSITATHMQVFLFVFQTSLQNFLPFQRF